MKERFCEVCHYFVPEGSSRKVCSDECQATKVRNRQCSIASRFVSLERILREEKIYWRDDRLIHSETFYEGLISWGCIYCEVSLENIGGVCLDRIDNAGLHNSWNVAPCCPTCNRLRSDEFNLEEARILGNAVRQIRNQRDKIKRK